VRPLSKTKIGEGAAPKDSVLIPDGRADLLLGKARRGRGRGGTGEKSLKEREGSKPHCNICLKKKPLGFSTAGQLELLFGTQTLKKGFGTRPEEGK